MKRPIMERVLSSRPQSVALQFSSIMTSWCGFLLERHRVFSGYESSKLWPTGHVVIVVSGDVRVEDRALAKQPKFLAGLGSTTIWPGGHDSKCLTWSGPCETVDVELDASVLQRLVPEGNPLENAELIAQPGIQDPQLARLVRAMEEETKAGCPAGRLYGESLSLALAVHVAARYAAVRPKPHKLGLSRDQLRRVLEYIHAHLGGDLSLSELAAVAGVCPQHFSMAFRRTTGVTPHRYVTRARITEAKSWLVQPGRSIAEVALELGFASQSHFTNVFHRMTGQTPHHYRREHERRI